MIARRTADDAYANAAHIPGGEDYYARWQSEAEAFRAGWASKELAVSYGMLPAQTYDIYHPNRLAKGTVIFLHGGYWKQCSPLDFSHLAMGVLQAGYAFAMPRYTLAPEARIGDITLEAKAAMGAIAHRTAGALFIAGHSAGGHLAARMGCADMRDGWIDRVRRIMPISPLSNLAPLMETTMNDTLKLDPIEAEAESPVNHLPPRVPVTVWVGGAERPVFLDQARWLEAAWGCDVVVDEGRHHFDVIEGLEDAGSALLRTLLA